MGLQIRFDVNNLPETPSFILAHRNGDRIGLLNNVLNVHIADRFNDFPEISFDVYKYDNEIQCNVWEEIKDFKLCYCREWNMWFDVSVTINDGNDVYKSISLKRLAESELSRIKVYSLEINTEADILRTDYDENTPTVICDNENTENSLLHRLLEKAPHYIIEHCDSTISTLVRSFSWDDITIDECLKQLAEEINCLIDYRAYSDENGDIVRAIALYDLESNCLNENCSYLSENGRIYRGEFTDVCPHCGSDLIKNGYGEDTTIFLTKDMLADEITFSTDVDSVKNCFRLVAGDDLMTATINNSMPNGSNYLWYFSKEMKSDMPQSLVNKLEEYEEMYQYYNDSFVTELNANNTIAYNDLITKKYQQFDSSLETIPLNITGYINLMKHYYNVIDFGLYLKSSLMPDWEMSDTNAELEAQKLVNKHIGSVAVTDASYISLATANSTVLNYVKLLVNNKYRVKIADSELENNIWVGVFEITNYSDENDKALTGQISIEINDEYEQYVDQQVKVALKEYVDSENPYDIESIFKLDISAFADELKKYSLDTLDIFHNACQGVLDVLTEQGVANDNLWEDTGSDLYVNLYQPYLQKLAAIQSEMTVRENEINIIMGKTDEDGVILESGMQTYLLNAITVIQDVLDMETFLGEELWLQLCTYRNEDTYSNENFISEGLTNNEIFENAKEFLEQANKEIIKSATLQHKITAKLKNLLVMSEFQPIVEHFKCGNWLRIKVEDSVYKLRLLEFNIDFNNLDDIDVEFSDVVKTSDGYTDVKSILDQASSMASSYGAVTKQVTNNKKSATLLNNWVQNGLDLTKTKIIDTADNQEQVWDSHGMLFRKYLIETDTYDDKQLKIINRGVYLTDDNWQTARAGIGNFAFYNPQTKKTEQAYGVIADTIVGNVILSKNVGIYNEEDSITMDKDGVVITSNNTESNLNLFKIRKKTSANYKQANAYINNLKNYGIIEEETTLDLTTNDTEILTSYIEILQSTTINGQNFFIENDTNDLILNSELATADGYLEINYLYNLITQKINNLANGIDTEIETFEDLFYINDNGNVVLNGTISVFSDDSDNTTLNDLLSVDRLGEELEGTIQDKVNHAATTIEQQYQDQIEELDRILNDYKTEVGQYLHYDENGLRLGATSSAFSTLIDNQGMYFKDNDVTVAYIQSKQLYIPDAVIKNRLLLGHFFFAPHQNDNGMSLIWGGNDI